MFTAITNLPFSVDADWTVETNVKAALTLAEKQEWFALHNQVFPVDTFRRISGGRTDCRMVATF